MHNLAHPSVRRLKILTIQRPALMAAHIIGEPLIKKFARSE